MRFRFVIDHRQLAAMIAAVLMLGLLSFLGGLSVGLLLQPQVAGPEGVAVAEASRDDPEPDRETAIGRLEVSTVDPSWSLGGSATVGEEPATLSEGEMAALAEGREPEFEAEDAESRGGRRAETPAARLASPGEGRGGWQPRSAYWQAFDRRLDPEAASELREPGRASRGVSGFDLSFRQGQAMPRVRYGEELYAVARDHDLNPALMAAMARVESGYDLRAVSHRGALGLMQVTPDTARRFGVDPDLLFEPEANLVAAARYLVWLRERFDDDPVLVLAAYNAGEAAVDLYGGVPNYPETRNYVTKVIDFYLNEREKRRS